MPSPNIGKSPVEQALCVARALMALSPAIFDRSIAMRTAEMRLKSEGRFVYDRWHRVVGDDYERYVKQFKSGGAVSNKTLPEGETSAFTIDVRGMKPVTDKFEAFVKTYVLSQVFNKVAFGEAVETTDAARLRKSLDACGPMYNEEQIRNFRQWLLNAAEQVFESHGYRIPRITPDHLVAFSSHLAALRVEFAADALLFGSIATACDICIELARRATADDGPERLPIFTALALPLIAGRSVDPKAILREVVQQAIDGGYGKLLLDVADRYRQDVNLGIQAALASTSVDGFLDKMYEILPRAHGSRLIYGQLVSQPLSLAPEQFSGASQLLNKVEEQDTRIFAGFSEQFCDLAGEQWESYCRKAAAIWRTSGEQAARDQAEEFVRLLVFPPAVVSDLLADAAARQMEVE